METYKTLVSALCTRCMIAANPRTLTIKINMEEDSDISYAEISIQDECFHVYMYNKYHYIVEHYYCTNIERVLGLLNE